jgi:hypothetical protein
MSRGSSGIAWPYAGSDQCPRFYVETPHRASPASPAPDINHQFSVHQLSIHQDALNFKSVLRYENASFLASRSSIPMQLRLPYNFNVCTIQKFGSLNKKYGNRNRRNRINFSRCRAAPELSFYWHQNAGLMQITCLTSS